MGSRSAHVHTSQISHARNSDLNRKDTGSTPVKNVGGLKEVSETIYKTDGTHIDGKSTGGNISAFLLWSVRSTTRYRIIKRSESAK